MNDETTRLINEGQSPKEEQTNVQSNAAENCTQPTKKSNRKGNTIAAGAGGFVAGAAVGAGATAAAQSPTAPEEAVETIEEKVEDPIETPEPEQVILANDEGIRYAHVDADNFNDAFAQARAQVGPGGVFEYNGKIYATYTAEEWNEMSAQERVDYQSKVYEVAPSHHAEPTHHAEPSHTHVAESVENHPEATAEEVPANAEMIAAEPVDNEIRVLGVEAVQNEYGQVMNVALVECEGDQALLIDVDNDGTIDVLIHDDNIDNQIQENEIHDISGAGLGVADLMQAQAAQEGDMLYASCDDMPDYVNDADSIMTV